MLFNQRFHISELFLSFAILFAIVSLSLLISHFTDEVDDDHQHYQADAFHPFQEEQPELLHVQVKPFSYEMADLAKDLSKHALQFDSRMKDCSKMTMTQAELAKEISSISLVILPPIEWRKDIDFVKAYEKTVSEVLSVMETELFLKAEVVIFEDSRIRSRLGSSEITQFRFVQPAKGRKSTLFEELIDLLSKESDVTSDFVVFLTAGMMPSKGWLEGSLTPFLDPHFGKSDVGSLDRTPLIIVPHFDLIDIGTMKSTTYKDPVRLLFHWDFSPMWSTLSLEDRINRESEGDLLITPTFLPQAFALRRSQKGFQEFLTAFSRLTGKYLTTLDASMAIYRCLSTKGAIYVAPCSRIASPYVYGMSGHNKTFDPYMVTRNIDVIQQMLSNWIDSERFRELVQTQLPMGSLMESFYNFGNCKNFKYFMDNFANDTIAPGDSEIAFGILRAGSGLCFKVVPGNRIAVADDCSVVDPDHIFRLDVSGALKTHDGKCVSKWTTDNYVVVTECGKENKAFQKWHFDQKVGGALFLRTENGDSCVMQATDAHQEFNRRQVLMFQPCDYFNRMDFKRFMQFQFTYQFM